MCMELLSFLIEHKCSSHLWDPLQVSRNGLAFLRLMFADDLILFAKADLKNNTIIKDVLDSFCEIFGQKVSLSKSRVYFSPNVPPHAREELCHVWSYPIFTKVTHNFTSMIQLIQDDGKPVLTK